VLNSKLPEFPNDEVPDENAKLPETPIVPEFGVATVTSPLLDDSPYPEKIETSPPELL
jgi:hypothetical protein